MPIPFSTTNIILPFGIDASITTVDNQYGINCGMNFDINDTITNDGLISRLVSQIQPNSPFRHFNTNNFKITTIGPFYNNVPRGGDGKIIINLYKI